MSYDWVGNFLTTSEPEMDELRHQIEIYRQAVIRDLLRALQLIESVPENELTPELRALQEEQRAALREDLMKVTGDQDGRGLRARIEAFLRDHPRSRRAG